MNKKDLVMLIMAKKTLDYQKDPNPDNWVTIKGAKVHLDEGGKVDGGAGGKFNGKSYSGTKKSRKTSESNNNADLEKRLKELKSKRDEHYWTITRSNSANKTESAGKELAKVDAEIAEIEKKLGKRKEFHELTKEQARRAHGMPENKHKERVEKALKEGKTVPENVLADYPDLKEKYGNKTPEIKTKEDALKRVAELYKEQDKPGFEKNPKANEMLEERAKLVEKFGINYSDVEKAYKGAKPEVGDKGMAFLKRMSVIHSSFDESTGYMARDVAEKLKEGKSLQEIKDYFYGNIEKWGYNKEEERKEVDHFIEAVKRADKGLDPWGKGEAKEPKKSAPKSAGKEDDVKQVEISFPGGYKGHFSQVPGEKDVIFDWDKMERMEIAGGLEAFLKKAREKGIEVNENYTPEECKLEEYPPNRKDRRLARMNKLQSAASRRGRPPGAR